MCLLELVSFTGLEFLYIPIFTGIYSWNIPIFPVMCQWYNETFGMELMILGASSAFLSIFNWSLLTPPCAQMLLWVLVHGEMEKSHFFLAGKIPNQHLHLCWFCHWWSSNSFRVQRKGPWVKYKRDGTTPRLLLLLFLHLQRDFREGEIPSLEFEIAEAALEKQQVPLGKSSSCSCLPEMNKCEVIPWSRKSRGFVVYSFVINI